MPSVEVSAMPTDAPTAHRLTGAHMSRESANPSSRQDRMRADRFEPTAQTARNAHGRDHEPQEREPVD